MKKNILQDLLNNNNKQLVQFTGKWKYKRLGDLAKIKTGLRNNLDKIDDGDYPFYVRSQVIERINSYSYDCEAVLVPGEGMIGNIFHYVKGRFDVHQRVYAITQFSNEVSGRYVHLYMRLNFGAYAMQNSVKATVDSLRLPTLQNFLIFLPPTFEEQLKIIAIYEALERKAITWRKKLTKTRQIKQGLMQELLTGKTRLPGFEGKWLKISLKNSASLKARIGWQGLTVKEYLDDGDFLLVTGTEITGGCINWKECHYVKENRYKQDRNIQLQAEDILVTKDGTIGKIAFVSTLPKPATLNSGVFVIRPYNQAFNSKFFFHLLSSSIFSDFLAQLAAGSTISHLYQKDFTNFSFLAPPTLFEQSAIADVLDVTDQKIKAISLKINKIRQIKQGMMQTLLTGKIRLPITKLNSETKQTKSKKLNI